MKILLINEFLKPQTHGVYGIAIRFEQYVKNFRNKNYNVRVYGPSDCPSSDFILPSIINCFNTKNHISFPSFQLIYDLCFNNYDIVHLVYPSFVPSMTIFLISLFKKINIVTSNHVNISYSGKPYNLVKFFICNLIMAPFVSKDLKTTIISSGIDFDNFKLSTNKRENILLYVGYLAPENNIDKLIKLFETIKNYKLIIVGYGSEEDKLKKLAKDNINIEFVGKVEHDILPLYYQKAKAHITLSETFCLTLLESLSCGTPIIFPNCTVFNSLYGKDFEKLCLTDNNTLGNIINYIEKNESDLQFKCKDYSEYHSWARATDQLINIYTSVSDLQIAKNIL